MRLIGCLAALGVLCLGAGTARADWEYTVWGMTAEEVLDASHGQAIPSFDRERDWEPFRAELKAPSVWHGFAFTAYFLFGPHDGELRYVSLVMDHPLQCSRLNAMLRQIYGRPAIDINKPVLNMSSWWRTRDNFDLLLTFTAPAPPFCELRLARPGQRPY
ncbi:MAG: hypothetical protein ACHQPH_14825 [Reyranellales bacterium]|jgi:hypothetical protein